MKKVQQNEKLTENGGCLIIWVGEGVCITNGLLSKVTVQGSARTKRRSESGESTSEMSCK